MSVRGVIFSWLVLVSMSGTVFSEQQPDPPVSDGRVIEERPDLAALAFTAAAEMRGIDSDNGNADVRVNYSPAARETLRKRQSMFAGFGVPRFAVLGMREHPSGRDRVEVAFLMIFSDVFQRRQTLGLTLECGWLSGGRKIHVDSAKVDPYVPELPEVFLTVVPAGRVPSDLLAERTHAELLPWIFANRATPEEFASGEAEECFLFATGMDRFDRGDSLRIVVSESSSGVDGAAGNCEDLDYEGWHVAVARGRFDWFAEDPFFIKVVYDPAEESEGPRTIHRLSSELVPVDGAGLPTVPGRLSWLDANLTRALAAGVLGLGLLTAMQGLHRRRRWWISAGAFGVVVAFLVVMDIRLLDPRLLLAIAVIPIILQVFLLASRAIGAGVLALAGGRKDEDAKGARRFCYQCGGSIENPSAAYCPQCGAKL